MSRLRRTLIVFFAALATFFILSEAVRDMAMIEPMALLVVLLWPRLTLLSDADDDSELLPDRDETPLPLADNDRESRESRDTVTLTMDEPSEVIDAWSNKGCFRRGGGRRIIGDVASAL